MRAQTLLRHRVFDGQNGRQFAHSHFGAAGRFARVDHLARHHHGHRLPQKFDLAVGQERVVVHDRAAIVLTWNIARSEHRHHAVLGQQSSAIDALTNQLTMGHG